jgi:HrpA-like RNA helicase
MPVDPRIGKMLVFGAMLGCLNAILTIAGAMQVHAPVGLRPSHTANRNAG